MKKPYPQEAKICPTAAAMTVRAISRNAGPAEKKAVPMKQTSAAATLKTVMGTYRTAFTKVVTNGQTISQI